MRTLFLCPLSSHSLFSSLYPFMLSGRTTHVCIPYHCPNSPWCQFCFSPPVVWILISFSFLFHSPFEATLPGQVDCQQFLRKLHHLSSTGEDVFPPLQSGLPSYLDFTNKCSRSEIVGLPIFSLIRVGSFYFLTVGIQPQHKREGLTLIHQVPDV